MQQLIINNASIRDDNYTPPIQSADTLFHFVSKLEYISQIIERFAFVPRYCVEDIDYLNINLKQSAYPMICFCDINLHRLHDHIHFYGGDGYGIAFEKRWGIKQAIQPVQYINPNSPLANDFKIAFNESIASDLNQPAQDYLLTQMLFLKPIQGTMVRNKSSVFKNFTDECEWRFIPDLRESEFPQVILEQDLFSSQTWNKAMESREDYWLKFQPDDVKYIILKSRDEIEDIIKILDDKKLDTKSINRLISKILIWEEMERDF